MPTAVSNNDRIRQIAILVSTVDSAAAQELLAHFPPPAAAEIRAAAARLGTVDPLERQQVLAEFRRSAAASASPIITTGDEDRAEVARHVDAAVSQLESPDVAEPAKPPEHLQPAPEPSAPWTQFGSKSLLRFVRGERPAVIAVVVSQLPPKVAVTILRELGPAISCDVMRRMSRLQDIAPGTKAAIDEHLAERFGQQQLQIQSEIENAERMQSLLNEAPAELQQQWKAALEDAPTAPNIRVIPLPPASVSQSSPHKVGSPHEAGSPHETGSPHAVGQALARPAQSPAAPPTLADLYDDATITTVGSAAPETQRQVQVESSDSHPMKPHDRRASSEATPDLLPFPDSRAESKSLKSSVDQPKFEQILDLPQTVLAELLSTTDSETVLLALAGATPAFMERFYGMLNRNDGRALDRRLKAIGPMQISDIDEAQRRIAQLALALSQDRDPTAAVLKQRAA